MDNHLIKLCEFLGIQERYFTTWGSEETSPLESILKVAKAFGCEDFSDKGVEDFIQGKKLEKFSQIISPIKVFYSNSDAQNIEQQVVNNQIIELYFEIGNYPQVVSWNIFSDADEGSLLFLNSKKINRIQNEFSGELVTEGNIKETVRVGDKTFIKIDLVLDLGFLSLGYHELELSFEDSATQEAQIKKCLLIMAPQRSYNHNQEVKGISLQLYGLNSKSKSRDFGNFGSEGGDFLDLKEFIKATVEKTLETTVEKSWQGDIGKDSQQRELCPEHDFSLFGLNPIHSLFYNDAKKISPYSPSSRLALNPIYLNLQNIPEFQSLSEGDKKKLLEEIYQNQNQAQNYTKGSIEEASSNVENNCIDYQVLYRNRDIIYQKLFLEFQNNHLQQNTSRAKDFLRYCEIIGNPCKEEFDIEVYCIFETIADQHGYNFTTWPESLRDFGKLLRQEVSTEVENFKRTNLLKLNFYRYLQWLVSRQLGELKRQIKQDFKASLYLDIALGADSEGCESWANSQLFAKGIQTGCPPDDLNREGQNWGFPPLLPSSLVDASNTKTLEDTLKQSGLIHYIKILRATMKYASVIRLDHVMSLQRLFWIPSGSSAKDGVYVKYPLEELLGVIALESQLNNCIVVGEDLGTVESTFQARLQEIGILSYKVFYFSKSAENNFISNQNYLGQALATTTTHDLPTLMSFLLEDDFKFYEEFKIYSSDSLNKLREERHSDIRKIIMLFLDEINQDKDSRNIQGRNTEQISEQIIEELYQELKTFSDRKLAKQLISNINNYILKSSSQIKIIQLEDLEASMFRTNIPGTINQHENWKRRYLTIC